MSRQLAIVGLSCRVPGAPDPELFWERIRAGDVCFSDLPEAEGEVGVRGVLDGADRFDAALFGLNEVDAAKLDPQHRVFLELCWHALEDAGLDPFRSDAAISLYATCSPPAGGELTAGSSLSEEYHQLLASAPDFLATRVSHRLDLKGESVVVQTGCSSSLVALHLACQSVLAGESDIAMAGGVSIAADQRRGYRHQDGMITSPSGRCRPFDADADGTVPGSGGGVVVIRPLEDALEAGDRIRAVIRGSAINNDGATKASFMAPSVSGQLQAVATALAVAEVDAETIGLLEAHGTATELGDAIEVAALKQAFEGVPAGATALGSLKGSVGHLDRAAGIAALIKAVLCLERRTLPPAPGSERPHPALQLEDSPFYLPREARPWVAAPRRAGVSSFGVGGTNVHVVLEQAPEQPAAPVAAGDGAQPLTVSASSPASLRLACESLAGAVERASEPLEAIAKTRNLGRAELPWRAAVAGRDGPSVAARLRGVTPIAGRRRPVSFLFQGHGARPVAGDPRLYEAFPAYRQAIDACAEALDPLIEHDLHFLIHDDSPGREQALQGMLFAQPALFSLEYAQAQLWLSWGVRPAALVGHSMGEVAAAAVAGVFELRDALRFVVERGRMLDASGDGAMLAVPLPEAELRSLLPAGLDIAAVNAPGLCVASGPSPAIAAFAAEIEAEGLDTRRLRIASAAHSRQMDPFLDELDAQLAEMALSAPQLPLISAVTGDWAEPEEVTRPSYWTRHFRGTVRYGEALATAAADEGILFELGHGAALSHLAAVQLNGGGRHCLVPALGGEEEDGLEGLVIAWREGVEVDWEAIHGGPRGRLAEVPRTPFDHSSRWVTAAPPPVAAAASRDADPGAWLYTQAWIPLPPASASTRSSDERRWLLLARDGDRLAARLADMLVAGGEHVAIVAGEPTDRELAEVTDVVDLTAVATAPEVHGADPGAALLELCARLGRLADSAGGEVRYRAVTRGHRPIDGESGSLAAAPFVALETVAPQELSWLDWVSIDLPPAAGPREEELLAAELLADRAAPVVALRDGRWFGPELRHAWPRLHPRPLRAGGCYLVTGGLGRVGQVIAEAIAEQADGAHLVLAGRGATEAVGVEAVDRLRAAGATVEIAQVDVSDEQALRALVDRLAAERGGLDGVVHAAGFTDRDRFSLLLEATPDLVERILAAKVEGTRALARALEGCELDFVVLCSSLSTSFGGLRYGPYVAANGFLDAFAAARAAAGDDSWLSLAWEAWLPAGAQRGEGSLERLALDDREGREAFLRALAAPGPVVTVSTLEPRARRASIAAELGRAAAGLGAAAETDELAPAGASLDVVVRTCVGEVLGAAAAESGGDLRELGGDSLSLLRIIGLLNRRLGIRLQPVHALRSPSVERLVSLCAAARGAGAEDDLPALSRSRPATTHPTTTLQRRWLQVAAEGFGSIDAFVRLEARDLDRLVRAVGSVCARHDGLRTRFPSPGEAAVQVIEDTVPAPLVVDAGDVAIEDVLRDAATEPFDFAAEPPLRLLLADSGEGQALLHIHVHHVLFDGTSSSIFLRDLQLAYETDAAPPGRPFQYADFAAWQQEYLGSPGFRRAREFWQRHFEGSSGPLLLPADLVGEDDLVGHNHEASLGTEEVERLRQAAQRADATPFVLLCAAYLLLLAEITGEDDIVIGTTAAGRPVPEAAEIVGCFVNPLPLRFQIAPDGPLDDLIALVRRRLLEFHQHQAYWLEDLVAHVDPFIGLGQNETFNAYILLQNYERPAAVSTSLPYAQVWPEGVVEHRLMRDLELVIDQRGDGLVLELWYRHSRFSAALVESWLDRYRALLARVVDDLAA